MTNFKTSLNWACQLFFLWVAVLCKCHGWQDSVFHLCLCFLLFYTSFPKDYVFKQKSLEWSPQSLSLSSLLDCTPPSPGHIRYKCLTHTVSLRQVFSFINSQLVFESSLWRLRENRKRKVAWEKLYFIYQIDLVSQIPLFKLKFDYWKTACCAHESACTQTMLLWVCNVPPRCDLTACTCLLAIPQQGGVWVWNKSCL